MGEKGPNRALSPERASKKKKKSFIARRSVTAPGRPQKKEKGARTLGGRGKRDSPAIALDGSKAGRRALSSSEAN